MSNMAGHWGNANQITVRTTSHSLGRLHSEGQTITRVGEDMEKLEPPALLEGKQDGAAVGPFI